MKAAGAAGGLGPLDLGVSLLVHALLAVLLVLGRSCESAPEPLFDPDQVMEVRLVALPKSQGRLPDRASRAPRPASGSPRAEAPPAASPMAYHDEKAPENRGADVKEREARREELLRELRRRELVESLAAAPLGDVDRAATSPDGVEGATYLGLGTGGTVDPELARYAAAVRARLLPHWAPLPRLVQEHPELVTLVVVRLDEDGRITDARIGRSSGNRSYDESCLRAVQRAGTLPLPPEKYRHLAANGIGISFPASDAGH